MDATPTPSNQSLVPALTKLLDDVLDRSVVLGFTRIGSEVRSQFWADDPEPDSMVGKRVLVTGATSGIGEAMARSFVELGATVHLLGRNPDKVAAGAKTLRLDHPNAEVVEEVCDLGDLDGVRRWATDFAARVPALHGIVHNAGVLPPERTESPQGHEMCLAVHVLGPHLVTELLADTLAAAAADGGPGASVVWMSSGGMYGAGLRDDDPEYLEGTYNGVQAYARTKRMQVVVADAWSRRLAQRGVKVESMHPGWVDTPGITESLALFGKITGPLLRTARDGADTAVWLVATRPDSKPYHFWHDRAQRPTTYGWQRPEDAVRVQRLLGLVSAATGTSDSWPSVA